MKTIKIISTDYIDASVRRDTVANNIYNQFVIPLFGANNENISNMSCLGMLIVGSYKCIDFDISGELLFRIRLSQSTNNDTILLYFELINPSDRETTTVVNTLVSTKITLTSKTVSGSTTYSIPTISFNYIVEGTELKALWLVSPSDFKPCVCVLDTIGIVADDSKEKVVMFITTSGQTTYKLNGTITYTILSGVRKFSVENKVYMEDVYFLDGGEVVGFFDNVKRIFNNSLGTEVYTEGSYKKLIEVDGVRYRQLGGQYWIEDKD